MNLRFFKQKSKDMIEWGKKLVRFLESNRIMTHLFSIGCVLTIFLVKYLSPMMLKNKFWQYSLWYAFLQDPPSSIGSAGLLDPSAMATYKKTLSISLGHQLVASLNHIFGFELGLAILYIIIVILVISAVYLLALHISQSRLIAFLVTFLLVNTDILAMAHVGACGHIGQTAVRDYLALGFFLLAIYFLFEKRPYLYWLCLLIGFLSHMSHGLMAFGILLPITWLSENKIQFKIFHTLSFCIIILCIYFFRSIGSEPITPIDMDLWFKWAYIFNGGHIFWDHSINYLRPTYAFFSLIPAGLSLIVIYPAKKKFLFSLTATWGILAAGATFFIYIVPLAIVYKLTPLRSSLLISALILIFLMAYLLKILLADNKFGHLMTSAAGIFATITGTFSGIFIASGITCILAGFHTDGKKRIACFLLTAVICILILLNHKEILTYDLAFGKKTIIILFIIFVLFASYVFAKRFVSNENLGLITTCIILVLALICVSRAPSKYTAYPNIQTIDKLNEYCFVSGLIRQNTTEADSILTAPLIFMPKLETTASRGSVFQLPKAAVVYMAPNLMPAINEALKDLGIDISAYNGTWVDLLKDAPKLWKKNATEITLKKLSNKYKAPCVLTYADHDLYLPVIYKGKYFNIYNLKDTDEKIGK